MNTKICISIPGKWKNKSDMIQQIGAKGKGFVFAADIIHHLHKNIKFDVEISPKQSHLTELFVETGSSNWNVDFLQELEEHTFVFHIFGKAESREQLENFLDIGKVLLSCGGIGVLNEVSMRSYSKEEWIKLKNYKEIEELYAQFVSLTGEEDEYFSIGMHSFGLPDAIISAHLSPKDATEILNDFNLMLLSGEIEVKDGFTLSFEENSSVLYDLIFLNDFRFEEDYICYNPYGIWRLQKR